MVEIQSDPDLDQRSQYSMCHDIVYLILYYERPDDNNTPIMSLVTYNAVLPGRPGARPKCLKTRRFWTAAERYV